MVNYRGRPSLSDRLPVIRKTLSPARGFLQRICISLHVTVFEISDIWAMLMNVSRPSLHRELRRMETEGLIRYTPHRIEILTPDGLEALLDT